MRENPQCVQCIHLLDFHGGPVRLLGPGLQAPFYWREKRLSERLAYLLITRSGPLPSWKTEPGFLFCVVRGLQFTQN
jgi:hypothetical protein